MYFVNISRLDFIKNNIRSVDEVWYKRAVEQHFIEPQGFVFSVPFNEGMLNDRLTFLNKTEK